MTEFLSKLAFCYLFTVSPKKILLWIKISKDKTTQRKKKFCFLNFTNNKNFLRTKILLVKSSKYFFEKNLFLNNYLFHISIQHLIHLLQLIFQDIHEVVENILNMILLKMFLHQQILLIYLPMVLMSPIQVKFYIIQL